MMNLVRVHFGYRHVDQPWGGANNFIRALYGYFDASPDFEMVADMQAPADILFLNQLGKGKGDGEGGWHKIADIKEWKCRNPQGKVVVRAVNLRAHSNPNDPWRKKFSNFMRDRASLAALNLADFCIFQSQYQQDFFTRFGYKGKRHAIIHNGASPAFASAGDKAVLAENTPVRCIATSMSKSRAKRHDIIARLSAVPNMDVYYAGAWPDNLDRQNVTLLGVQTHEEIMAHMGHAHYFLHPAQNDVCPNSVIEALRFGLPVLYYPGPGSSAEIVRGFGVALDENNLETSASEARALHAGLSAGLAADTRQFSVDRAAEEYAACFMEALRR